MDWEDFRKMLEKKLTTMQEVEELTLKDKLLNQITKLDTVIKETIK